MWTVGALRRPWSVGVQVKTRTLLARCAVTLAAAIGLLSTVAAAAAPTGDFSLTSYVLLGEDGARVARVITPQTSCPGMTVDGQSAAMAPRAPAGTVALRTTISPPTDSKPSTFDGLVCEATIPATAKTAAVAGRNLPLPPAVIRRVVVIGDTGCRIKTLDNASQACNDSKAYPFAQVAASVAAWKPDVVVHVGDFLYRENACPTTNPGCAGSPWGYGADAWRADFFTPAEPMLTVAPLAFARGNHESCARGGQGWWRYLDPHAYVPGRDCNDPTYDTIGDYTDPYAVPLGDNAQLIFFDSSNAPGKALSDGDIRAAHYRDAFAKIAALAAGAPHSILVNHHPILGFAMREGEAGPPTLAAANGGLQSVFGALSPRYLPQGVDLTLAGHIHVWEAVSFTSDQPGQIIAGFSGTLEDIVPIPATPPADATPAKGAVVKALSSWVDGFGFMTMERRGDDAWDVQVRDATGAVVNTCRIWNRDISCATAQVVRPH